MKDIINFLYSRLNLKTQGKKALKKLLNGNAVEKRLIICVAIDLKNGLIDNTFVEKILNNLSIKIRETLLEQYDNQLTKIQYFTSNIKNDKNDKLVRVIPLKTFNTHFYNKFNKLNGIYNNIKKTNQLREEIERGNLEDFKMSINNDAKKINRLVWVTPKSEFENIKTKHTANEIIKMLGIPLHGLKKGESKEYVYIIYPDNFNEILYQPSHNSNYWSVNETFFLSFKKFDNYGRTRCYNGDFYDKRMKELVHNSIDIPKYSFNINYLGKITDNKKETTNFVIEAINRFYEK